MLFSTITHRRLPSSKSDTAADAIRAKGNKLYQENKFYEALICFNESLCRSESSVKQALAFANRSAVYLESKKYQECLDNIQMARENRYPTQNMERLNERERKCKEMMEICPTESKHKIEARNFFKLSYPPNKRIPFMVNCLELKKNEKFGRHIVTNRDLNPGDIIMIEEPYKKYLLRENCYERCYNCLKSNNLSLIPCTGGCVTMMFCSEKCMQQTQTLTPDECSLSKQYIWTHMIPLVDRIVTECLIDAGGIDKLRSIAESHEHRTVFDFDLASDMETPEMKQNFLIMFLSLYDKSAFQETRKVNWMNNYTRDKFKNDMTYSNIEKEFLSKFYLRVHNIYEANSLSSFTSLRDDNLHTLGSGVFLASSFFNHSCDPSVEGVVHDGKIVLFVTRPVKAGEQLFTNYCETFIAAPRCKRQSELLAEYGFNCTCVACTNDYKMHSDLKIKDRAFRDPGWSTSNPIQKFKRNCKYLKKNFHNHPSYESTLLIMRNTGLMAVIGETEFF